MPLQAAPNSPFWFKTIIAPKKFELYFRIRSMAKYAASFGVFPCRRLSTAKNDGKNRIITSPSPVADAAPTPFSAYAPAPLGYMKDIK